MKVRLVGHTTLPERICGLASKTCVSENPIEADFDDLEKSLASAMKSGHLSVLEHASFTFYIEGISRACSHQLVRHRMASYAQQSQRYVTMRCSSRDPFDFVIPASIQTNRKVMDMYDNLMRTISEVYGEMVGCFDIPAEDARYILPNACCTNIVVTMNARSLLHLFELRLCNRAQWEIREMATLMLEEVREVAPALFETAGPACARGPCPEGKRSCGHAWKEFNDYKFEEKAGDDEPRRTKVGDDPVLDLQMYWKSMTQEERERAYREFMSEWEKEASQ